VRDRAAQRDEGERQAREALQEAERLQGEERWYEALAAVKRAQGALVGAAGTDVAEHARDLHADLEMVLRLEDARLVGPALGSNQGPDWAGSDAAYAAAFQAYGLDPDGSDFQQTAQRLAGRSIRLQLAAALDGWAGVRWQMKASNWTHLKAAARLIDPDPWRNRLRDLVEARDTKGFVALASSAPLADWPPATTVLMSIALRGAGQAERAAEVLEKAQQLHPADFWVNSVLAESLDFFSHPPRLQEAIRYYTAARALRPKNLIVLLNLGWALRGVGRLDESIAVSREALRLKPDFLKARANLADALEAKGEGDEAIAVGREGVRLLPDSPKAHLNLGLSLEHQGQRKAAIGEYREAIRIEPTYFAAHTNLGVVLSQMGDQDAAIAEHRAAIRIMDGWIAKHPEAIRTIAEEYALARTNLGNDLREKGLLDEAIAECREALRLQKDYPVAHNNLGYALAAKGQLHEAIAEYREALRLKPDLILARNNLAVAETAEKLPGILKGETRPAGAADCIRLALVCQQPFEALYAASVRFYEQAFGEKPELADDLRLQHRYNAACAAALAGCGQGKDADKLDLKGRARLRRQALTWLRADLAAWHKVLEGDRSKGTQAIRQQMQHWLEDADFASVRGPEALAKLPEAERGDWQRLWHDVQALLEQAARPPKTAAAPPP
jgi:serine/threonine-protein kinase